MSDKDLVSRRRVLARKKTMYGWSSGEEEVVSVEYIESIPPVKQPMSAREFARERDRMCVNHTPFCNACPVLPERMEGGKVMHDCPIWTMRDPDKAIAIVEKWAQEHLEEVKDEID